MKFKASGLIVREQAVGENDKLITVLTDSLGIVKAFVRGAKNIRSPKSAATQLLCYSQLCIYKNKDKYIIDEASVKEMFVRLRTDVVKMSFAQYFCELAINLCPKEQSANDHLRLLLNGVYLLASGKRDPLLVKACVEMRLLCLAGYMPDLLMCRGCGKYETENMLFLPEKGAIICESCYAKSRVAPAQPLTAGALQALRHTAYADFEKLFSFHLSETGLKSLNRATEQYLAYCTEYCFKTLQFLHDLN